MIQATLSYTVPPLQLCDWSVPKVTYVELLGPFTATVSFQFTLSIAIAVPLHLVIKRHSCKSAMKTCNCGWPSSTAVEQVFSQESVELRPVVKLIKH